MVISPALHQASECQLGCIVFNIRLAFSYINVILLNLFIIGKLGLEIPSPCVDAEVV
jgi:hypothetical protein